MIAIVLDTNILHKSPYLSRDEWVSLSTHKDEWKVRILVPEVVVMETTNTVPREWTKQKDIFSTAKVGVFGLQDDVDAIVRTIEASIESYGDTLKRRLSELGAEVLADPEVSHTRVAERASKGIAPYQGKATKDNYRDTLIWLSVIEAAQNNLDHEVWFVSENHKDFGALDAAAADQVPRALHKELQKELASLGLENKVKYAANLAALVQHISSVYGPIETEELSRLMAAVDYDGLGRFLNEQVLWMTAPARDVALDPTVSIAVVSQVLSPTLEWMFSDEAKNGEGEWTANYVVVLEAVVAGYSPGVEEMRSVDNKVLRVSGTVTFTDDGTVEKFEVTRLEAPPEDPNHALWSLLDQTGFPELGNFRLAVTDRIRSGFTLPSGTMEAMRRIADQASGATLPAETLKSMRRIADQASGATLPAETLKSMRRIVEQASGATLPAETLKSMRRITEAAVVQEDPDEKESTEEDTGQESSPED